ncbi:MAG TPA: helix-turn-helix domain-containing protein [Gammaproteobacteria bacterium]|nr:helix-turn-helix domain-containing protein [Gammaproteobacteria bacterium]
MFIQVLEEIGRSQGVFVSEICQKFQLSRSEVDQILSMLVATECVVCEKELGLCGGCNQCQQDVFVRQNRHEID